MNSPNDSTPLPPSSSSSSGGGPTAADKREITSETRSEIDLWQARIDAAKLQMHLEAREARDKLRPHIERLEMELSRINAGWEQLEASSGSSWKDIHHGLKVSLNALRRSYDKATQHLDPPDNG